MIQKIKKHIVVSMVIFSFLLLQISAFFSWDENPVMGFDKMCVDLLIIGLSVLAIRKLGLWKTAGFQAKGVVKGLIYGIPFVVIGVCSVFVSNAGIDFQQLSFISVSHFLIFTGNMILVGANEEIWMRSLVLNSFVEHYGTDNGGVWKALFASAAIFGAIHLPNLFFMEPMTLLMQVVNAMAAGVLFGVIFLKSKNIWSGIIIHTLVDWLSLVIGNCFTGGNSVLGMSMSIGQAAGMILAGSVPPLFFAVLYMRRGKND